MQQLVKSLPNTAYRVILLLCCMVFVTNAQARQQGLLKKKISISLNRTDLKTALEKISDASGVAFNYSSAVLNEKQIVSIHATDKPVDKVLDEVLDGLPFSYRIFEGEVMIRYEPAKLQKQAEKPAPTSVKDDPEFSPDPKPVKGIVVDNQGKRLAGATVYNGKTKKSTTTNEDGAFTIEASQDDELFISYVGFEVKRQIVGRSNFYNISLSENQKALDVITVVSTGYQNIDRRRVTGSTYTLKSEDLVKAGTINVDGLLQGKVPGLTVINNSGSATATPTVRIRGTSTFVGNATPLWVVDGLIQEDPVNLSPLQTDVVLSQARTSNFSIIGNAIAGLNPSDIESITFLKDAAASSIYGVRAANGVIVVTTKRGKSGAAPYISYNGDFGFTGRPTYDNLNLMNSKERIDVSKEIVTEGLNFNVMPFGNSYEGLLYKLWNHELSQAQFDTEVGKLQSMNTDWYKLLFRNAFSQGHALSLSGGSVKNSYYASLGYNDSKGSAVGDDLRRYSAMLKTNVQVNDRLRLDVKVNASIREAKGFFTINPYDYAYRTSRALDASSPYATGNAFFGSNEYEASPAPLPLNFQFANERSETGNTSNNKSLQGVISLQYKILKGLNFESLAGISYQNTESQQWATERSFYIAKVRGYNLGGVISGSQAEKNSRLPLGGILHYMSANNTTYTVRNSLTWTKPLFNEHELQLFAGQEIRSVKSTGMQVQEWGYFPERGRRISYDYNITPGSSQEKHTATVTDNVQNYLSWYGTATYSIQNKYMLNLSMRSDASNRFGQYTNHKFQPAYSISGRWAVAQESWLKDSRIISNLDLRASYGIQGNVVTAVGPELIAYYPNSGQDRLIDVRSNQYLLRLRSLGYPDLRWEQSRQANLRLDAGFFNNRVNILFEYYQKKSVDLLLLVNIPYEQGYTGMSGGIFGNTPPAMYVNIARVKNHGVESGIEVVPVRTKDWEWSVKVIASTNTNRSGSNGIIPNENDYLNGNVVVDGRAINGFWSYSFKGLNPANGLPTFNLMETEGKTPEQRKNPANMLVYSGKRIPDVTGGFQTQLRYRNFQFMAAFTYAVGAKKRLNPLFGRTSNVPAFAPQPELNLSQELVNRWRKPGDEAFTNIPVIVNRGPISEQDYRLPNGNRAYAFYMYDNSDARVVSANFIRCTNMSIGYAVPVKFLAPYKLKNAAFTLSGNNLFVIKDKRLKGQDPETDGFGGATLPILPSYYLSVRLGF